MIALAASKNDDGSSFACSIASANPVSSLSIGNCRPMIPVDATNTSSALQPRSSPAFVAVFRAFSRPSASVAALAFPELITIARIDFDGNSCRSHRTGMRRFDWS